MDFDKLATRSIPKYFTLIKCHYDHRDAFRQFHRLDRQSFKTVLAMVAPFITKIGHKHDFSSIISLSKVSAIFNFEIGWGSNPISLAKWLIWLSLIHTFTAHDEESVFRGQKYPRWQIFSSQPHLAKLSGKLRRTREETAEETSLPSHLLSCLLPCAAGLKWCYTR